ncbi:MAG: (2Fe-2S)-binding protein [Actinobacteria bacterium]|nr:(2Fe-2S)-binding protein [Actinomycetota bacterium]
MNGMTVRVRVNSEPREWSVASNDLLLNVLRGEEELTGTKYGCGIGECGACTVLVDGQPVLSCLTLATSLDGRDVVTIEGIADEGQLHPVQESFLECAALQCGFCTPGMIMMSSALLSQVPNPSEEDVRHFLRGCLCRCTGYAAIVRAVLAAADKANPDAEGPQCAEHVSTEASR